MEFLIDKIDQEKFASREHTLDRYIEETTFSSDRKDISESVSKIEINDLVLSELDDLLRAQKNAAIGESGLKCLIISINDGDGMSWVAEGVNEAIEIRYGDKFKKGIWQKICINKPSSLIPSLHKFWAKKRFIKYLTKNFGSKNSVVKKYLPFLIAFIIFFSNIMVSMSTERNLDFEVFLRLENLLLFFGSLMLAFLAEHLISILKGQEKEIYFQESIENFELGKQNQSENYFKTLNLLRRKLKASSPRIVILESFNEQDTITRTLVQEYLTNFDSFGSPEFWVILEANRSGQNGFYSFYLENIHQEVFNNCWKTRTFRLNPISREEKARLIQLLNLPSENQHFKSIKNITGKNKNNELFLNELVELKTQYSSNLEFYNELDLFFLLSLISSPSTIFFSRVQFINILSPKNKSGIRSIVLRKFLRKTKLLREEYKEKLIEIFPEDSKNKGNQRLARFIEKKVFGNVNMFTVIPDIKNTLEANYGILNLQNPKIGHLFWALYWGDKTNSLKTSSWFDKLAYHLGNKGDLFVFDDLEITILYERLFDIYLQTIDGCLTTGLYEHLPKLIDDVYSISREDIFKDRPQIRRLKIRAWKVFFILQDEKILSTLLKLYSDNNTTEELGDDKSSFEKDLIIFWETIKFRDSRRPESNLLTSLNLQNNVLAKKQSERELNSIRHYSEIFALWTKTNLMPFSSMLLEDNNERTNFFYLNNYFNDFSKRLFQLTEVFSEKFSENIISEIDFMSLSNLAWTLALNFRHFNKIHEYYKIEFEDSDYADEKIHSWLQNEPTERLVLFIKLLETYCLISKNLFPIIKKNSLKLPESQYFKKVLVFDVYCNMLMSSISIFKFLSENKRLEKTLISSDFVVTHMNTLVVDINKAFKFDIPEIEAPTDLIEDLTFLSRVDSFLKLCVLTYKGLDLDSLSHCLSLKTIHYKVFREKYRTNEKIEKAGRELAKYPGIYGVFFNLILAENENTSIELKSHHFLSALKLSLDNNLGENLKSEMLILILSNYNFIQNLPNGSQELLKRMVDSNYFDLFLSAIEEDALSSFVLKYYASRHLIEDGTLTNKIEDLILLRVNTLTLEKEKKEILSFIKSKKIIAEIDEKKISYSELSSNWDFGKQTYTYASILVAFLKKNIFNTELKNDVIFAINKNFNNYKNNAFLILSNKFSEFYMHFDMEESRLISDYLKNAIVEWERRMSADFILSVYKNLKRLNPDGNGDYSLQIEKWTLKNALILRRKRIALIDNRRYFDMYRFTYQMLMEYGLQSDIEIQELEKRKKYTSNEVQKALDSWIKRGATVPKPFVIDNNGVTVISSEFVLIGEYLFESSFFNKIEYSKHRKNYHIVAGRNGRKFFELMKELPRIPNDIRTIIDEYANRYEQMYNPEEIAA